jgi:hypothetical protein
LKREERGRVREGRWRDSGWEKEEEREGERGRWGERGPSKRERERY